MEDAKPRERNKHIREFLEYYIALQHAPRYAVLLNGPWGIGKTFLAKNFLDTHFSDRSEYVYLSLYGLSSIDEIDEALMAALYPALTSATVKLAGRVVKSILKYARFDLDITAKDVLGKARAGVYVFDDLERCELEINQVLGYINELVEQDECKVVIIANEKEIKDFDKYRLRREKLVGKTLECEPAFDEAFAYFVSLVDDASIRTLLRDKFDDVARIYIQCELHNLRILQQTIWDFERVVVVLSEEQRRNDLALSVLVRMFFALSFEVKSGRMGPSDLDSRMMKLIRGRMVNPGRSAQPTPMEAADARYPGTCLDESILSDRVLTDILCRGVVNAADIVADLNRSEYFVSPENEPSWRVLWHAFERSDEDCDRAAADVQRRFDAREFTVTGEILHVFGLRLWLARIGVLDQSCAQIVEEGKAYIDDLYREERLESLPSGEVDEERYTGFGGLGIHENETGEYRELCLC